MSVRSSKLCLVLMMVCLSIWLVPASADDSSDSPDAMYLKSMCQLFHDDGKLMAHIVIDATDPLFLPQEKVREAAKHVMTRLSSVSPSTDFKQAHEKLLKIFSMVGSGSGAAGMPPIGGQMIGVTARDLYPYHASEAFKDFHDAVKKAMENGLAPQYDPWQAAAKDPDGQANTADSSEKFGLDGPLKMQISGAQEKDKLTFGGFFEAVGVKQDQ
jgi:hypothetical protein